MKICKLNQKKKFIFNNLNLDGENYNSCVDSCADEFDYKYSVNLDENISELLDDRLIEVLDESNINATNCSKNSNLIY